nr:phosphoethanolamine N-methyltransferase 1-like [Penaeus vannamei]
MAATVQEEKLRQKMKKLLQVYSPSLESMMLSNDAKYLAENEQNEVMSYLPPYQGKRVLELGAGIGMRFTARLATVAGHVTAVDFMQEYIDKNEHENKHMGNISFMCADVTKLDFPAGSFDLVFSNWLFMYSATRRRNVKRNENPTLYRTPLEYCHMLPSATAGGQALFKILRGKSILTYIHYHGNPNQLCFLARRVDGEESDQLAQFLQREYSVVNILGRERAHGYMWWSTGGETTNRDFCARLSLRPGMRVLDVGCGTGGRPSTWRGTTGPRLQFEISDILTVDYERESYDVIYSRDSIFHIPEKQKLFRHIYRFTAVDFILALCCVPQRWLRPGGIFFFTDFCSGPAIPSREFLAYIDGAKPDRVSPEHLPYQHGISCKVFGNFCVTPPRASVTPAVNSRHRYSLAGKDVYVKELESAGFTDVTSEDLNEDFMKISKAELKAFTSAREAFISDFSEEDFAEISSTLANKYLRIKAMLVSDRTILNCSWNPTGGLFRGYGARGTTRPDCNGSEAALRPDSSPPPAGQVERDRGSMSNKAPASQEFLDTNQYSRKSILRYERIFGHTWVSTGGEATSKDLLIKMGLRPGMRVLDVGCGTGGSAFYMARHYGVHVHGVDLSTNMIDIAKDRLNREEKYLQSMIKFEVGDITKVQYDNASYDIIYSRDTILHIPNKEDLYRTLQAWLKPGGKLFVTDYCRGDQEHSQEFLDYVKRRGYDLRTVKAYGKVLEEAGFKDVQAVDMTPTFISVLQNELKYFEPTRDAFIQDYSEKDYKEIVDGWRQKLVRCSAGDQAWGMFLATR